MEETSIHFRVAKLVRNRFNSKVTILGLSNKEVLTSFIQKFYTSPQETLKFLGIEPNNY